MIYLDGKSGRSMVKRFQVLGVTRDKEYDLTKGERGSKVLYFTANPNGEAELITFFLTSGAKARVKVFDFDFTEIEIKGRGAGGNIATRYPVRKIQLKMEGKSTLGGVNIWYDDSVGRLNRDDRGRLLGNFQSDDKILVIFDTGEYQITSFELTNRYEADKIHLIEKFNPNTVISAIHYDPESQLHLVKRFQIETSTLDKKFVFIIEQKGAKLVLATTIPQPQLEVTYMIKGLKERKTMSVDLDMLIDVKGWKAMGNKLSPHSVKKVTLLNGNTKENKEAPEPANEGGPDSAEETQNEPIAIEETAAEETTETIEVEEAKPEAIASVEPPKNVDPPKPAELPKQAPPKAEPKPPPNKGRDKDGGYNVGETIDLF
jgi:topoisomerase-4 subunit A